jgi:hypothetical protein
MGWDRMGSWLFVCVKMDELSDVDASKEWMEKLQRAAVSHCSASKQLISGEILLCFFSSSAGPHPSPMLPVSPEPGA